MDTKIRRCISISKGLVVLRNKIDTSRLWETILFSGRPWSKYLCLLLILGFWQSQNCWICKLYIKHCINQFMQIWEDFPKCGMGSRTFFSLFTQIIHHYPKRCWIKKIEIDIKPKFKSFLLAIEINAIWLWGVIGWVKIHGIIVHVYDFNSWGYK